MKIDLASVVPDPSLEKKGYHELSEEQLRLKDDPQALLDLGIRLLVGIGVRRDEVRGRGLVISSAKFGHPVALASCFRYGDGTKRNMQRAIELFRDSASRGDATGI
jgi:TPR repeat protein